MWHRTKDAHIQRRPTAAAQSSSSTAPAAAKHTLLMLHELVQQQAATNQLLSLLLHKADASHRELRAVSKDVSSVAGATAAIHAALSSTLRQLLLEVRTVAAAARLLLTAAADDDAGARLRSAVFCGRCCMHASMVLAALRSGPRLVARACTPARRRVGYASWAGIATEWAQQRARSLLMAAGAGVTKDSESTGRGLWCSIGAAGWFAVGWLILTGWAYARWNQQRGKRNEAKSPTTAASAAAAAASSDPLVHLLAAALPILHQSSSSRALLPAAVELYVYDSALGAASLWLMGAGWRRWAVVWFAWAGATLWLQRGHSIIATQQPQPHGKAAAAAHRAGGAAAAGQLLLVAGLQVVVPLCMGWWLPW